jgi:uncharacterized protein
MPVTDDLKSSDVAKVRAALEAGIDPNAFVGGDADDRRALAIHCFGGRIEIARLLLEYHADPNLGRESTQETPLHHTTAGSGRIEIIRMLLQAGADPNRKASVGLPSLQFNDGRHVRGETPLHRAAAYAEAETVRLLVESAADKTARDANGESPLDWAKKRGRDADLLNLLG